MLPFSKAIQLWILDSFRQKTAHLQWAPSRRNVLLTVHPAEPHGTPESPIDPHRLTPATPLRVPKA